ncbi:MAG TPA: helix-turn-helix transcriptional regulator [Gammaproteobacteria bacterium]|nr:helix-turn-helix transcriptional regulator [Gammaproteobacteria bacterium]
MAESPICKRLKEARLAAGLSQKKLGIAAGMDEFSASARMNHYEIGRHTPDYSMLKSIAKILKLPVAYFYAENDELAEVIKLFHLQKKSEKVDLLITLRKSFQRDEKK